MKVNPKIRELLKEISKESVGYANEGGDQYRYIRRFLKLFNSQLTEEERIYITAAILEYIHYRNITTDHDTLMVMGDVRIKMFMGVATISVIVMVIAAVLFKTNDHLNSLVDILLQFTKILSI